MKVSTLLLLVLMTTVLVDSSRAPDEYEAINGAPHTPGGIRFDKEIGLDRGIDVMVTASTSFWSYFYQKVEANRNNVTFVVLVIQSMDGIVTNINNNTESDILMSADYIANYSGDLNEEFTGIMYHEIARARQWDGRGQAPIGLLTGIADFFRLNAGYASGSWGKPGSGLRWDEGYGVTARFLEYCNSKYSGLVVQLNSALKYSYSKYFFVQFTGKTVDELWYDYKTQYAE